MTFDAYVTEIIFDRAGRAWFALGDGTIAGESGERVSAHDGAVLAAAAHPSGEGVVSGGDDGRLVWTRDGEAKVLAEIKGRWIDAVASSTASGLIGFAAGREAHVRDVADAKFARVFAHEKTVAHLAFDPKGRRLACATYGGAMLWYARIAEQKPAPLKWAGSHILCAFSPDGRFLMSSMQENQLHGWRLSDAKDLRMGGYPTKVKSLAFVAGTPDRSIMAAGVDDGRVWACNLTSRHLHPVKAEKGAAITALAMSAGGARLAWGDEDGGAGVVELPAL